MATAAIIAAAALGTAGAVAGSKKDVATTRRELVPPSLLEQKLAQMLPGRFEDFIKLSELGFSKDRISRARDEQFNFLSELQRIGREGFEPTRDDIRQARRFGAESFLSEEQGLQEQFRQEETDTRRLSAQLGRSADDPVLRAKLAQSRITQRQQLGARRGQLESQLIRNAPRERFGFQAQAAQGFQAFAQQALSNRQAALNIGLQALLGQQAVRSRDSGIITESGGGFKGLVSGLFSGIGAGASIAGAGGGAPTGG